MSKPSAIIRKTLEMVDEEVGVDHRKGQAPPCQMEMPINAILADRVLRDLIEGANGVYDALDAMMATDGDAFDLDHRAAIYDAMRALQALACFLGDLRLNGRA
jgi:hypothetical protein